MLACEMTGRLPSEVLNLDPLEAELVVKGAKNLEEWRWENWQKLLGG